MSSGGKIDWVCETNRVTVRTLQVISEDLIVVSICGGPPEYVMSANYARRYGERSIRVFDALLRRESEIWENEGGSLLPWEATGR